VRAVRELVVKDLRVLRRSPVLAATLLIYPLLVTGLVGLVAGYANQKPRVAFVDEDGLPSSVTIGARTFDIQATIDAVAKNATLVKLSAPEAERELRDGRVVGVITVPDGFLADLIGMVRSPQLQLETGTGGIEPRVTQQVEALVYSLNRELQDAYIAADLRYVRLIQRGGSGSFLGERFDVLGLDGTKRLLAQLPPGPQRDAISAFVDEARKALARTGSLMAATAHPIVLHQVKGRGRTWVLSAQVQAYALAITITFLALVLAAGALAAERDELVLPRLARGLASLSEVVAAKALLATVIAVSVGVVLALAFGVVVEVGGIRGGEPWARLPLLVVGLALAGIALGALGAWVGALARDGRTASLVAVLLVLPVIFLGLVPPEFSQAAGWISDAFPFVHAARFFTAALFALSPWRRLAIEAAWLVGLGAVYFVAARAAARRLLV
jgi:ABC-2 type transport system permease protein